VTGSRFAQATAGAGDDNNFSSDVIAHDAVLKMSGQGVGSG
jgi:hypothetical protein